MQSVRDERHSEQAAIHTIVSYRGRINSALLRRICRCEFIRTRLETQDIDLEGQKIRVTTSGGLATFPGDANSPEELIAAADVALYQAKANGRNRVEVFTSKALVLAH